jgi:Fe-S cluster assembly iron-binding protein IscA
MNGIKITKMAAARLKAELDAAGVSNGKCLRLVSSGRCWSLELDSRRRTDLVVEHEDRAVLLVDPETATRCSEMTVDFWEGAFRLA